MYNSEFGTFKVPRKFSGQWTILKVFTKTNLISTGIFGSVGYALYKILTLLGYDIASICVLVVFVAIGYLLGTIKISEEDFNSGGDYRYLFLFREIKHKFSKKIYMNMNGFEGNKNH